MSVWFWLGVAAVVFAGFATAVVLLGAPARRGTSVEDDGVAEPPARSPR